MIQGHVAVILDHTNFYAEQGGQIYDTGRIELKSGGTSFKVESVKTFGGFVTHNIKGINGSTIKVGDHVVLKVDYVRRAPIKANHTSTHMLNYALRSVLGEGVEQEGYVFSSCSHHNILFTLFHSTPAYTYKPPCAVLRLMLIVSVSTSLV